MKYHRLRIFPVLFALTAGSSYLHASGLTAGTNPINLSCTQGQSCSSEVTSQISFSSANSANFYSVGTIPSWLQVSPMSGTLPDYSATPNYTTLTFQVSPAWTNLAIGSSSASVVISVGSLNVTVTVNLEIANAAPTLSVKGGASQFNALTMPVSGPAPTMTVTVLSSNGLPMPYSVAVTSNQTPEGINNWLGIQTSSSPVTSENGTIYSWGASLTFVAANAAVNQALPGDVLTGSIVFTTSTQTVTMPVAITVNAGTAGITSTSPSAVPLLASGVTPGTVTFVVHGTNFVSTTGSQKTSVFYGATAAACNNKVPIDNVTVLNSNYLTVAVPYTSAGSPFATAGSTTFYLGVANNSGSTSPTSAPSTATVAVTVTSAPIISAIVNAASFVDNGANPKAAPYDVISIFGTNFCPLCTGNSSVLVGTLDNWDRFPSAVSPDSNAHYVSVAFSKPGGNGTPANLPGYILFATNNQINVLVPGAIATLVASGQVNVLVGYDTHNPATTATAISAPMAVTAVLQDPGIFTSLSDGTGQGIITDTNGNLNSATNVQTTGNTVTIWMTGLGSPDAATTNSTSASSPGSWTSTGSADPYNCIALTSGVVGSATASPGSYMQTIDTPAAYNPLGSSYVLPSPLWTSIDGAVINPAALNANINPPCFSAADVGATNLLTVTIDGQPHTVANGGIIYAGWSAGSVAGLYQINVTLIGDSSSGSTGEHIGGGSATAVPVIVTVGTGGTANSSQAGVTMYVQ